MKALSYLFGALAALLLIPALPARADPPIFLNATSACGTPGFTPVTGQPYPGTMGPDGSMCVKATVTSGGVTPDSATTTGTIAGNSDTVILTTTGGYSTFAVTVTGNGSGTMQVNGSRDCTNYGVTTALPLANGIPSTIINANGTYQGNMGGLKCIKISGLSIVSGTYTVALSASVAPSTFMQDNIPTIVGGYSTGASTTSSTATVKAASTPAATTDTSLVDQQVPASHGQVAALATAKVLKASAGILYTLDVQADSTLYASTWYVLVLDATADPGNGAVTPAKCYTVPANQASFTAGWPSNGVALTTGITVVVSTTGCFTETQSAHAFISGEFK